VGINGKDVPNSTVLLNAIAEIPPGRSVPVRLIRRNQEITVEVMVGRRKPRARAEE
jgi:serine protease DegQ